MARGRRTAVAIAAAVTAAALWSAAPASASRVSAPGLRFTYAGAPGEVNEPQITFRVAAGTSPLTAEVRVTDRVPITVDPPCTRPFASNSRVADCTVELSEELPRIDLGNRDDRLTVRGTQALVLDGPGDDTIFALTSALWANGPGADTYRGGPGRDVVRRPSGFGADRIFGGSGNDLVYAGPGRDRVLGGPGADQLYGDSGDDRLFGGGGNDGLHGGAGRDSLFGGPGSDRLDGRMRDFFFG